MKLEKIQVKSWAEKRKKNRIKCKDFSMMEKKEKKHAIENGLQINER